MMTLEQACQAEQDRYGNIAVRSTGDLRVGQILRADGLSDLSGPVVVVGITTLEEWERRNTESGIAYGPARPFDKFYLVRAE
jgi:hypothetical protein